MLDVHSYVIIDENRMHNTEKHDQSISAGLYYTVTGKNGPLNMSE